MRILLHLAWILVLGAAQLPAQIPAEPNATPKPETAAQPDLSGIERFVADQSRATPPTAPSAPELVRILSDLQIDTGEEAGDAVVVLGRGTMNGTVRRQFTAIASDVTINGLVMRDLVVVMGKVKLGPKAEVRGNTRFLGCEVELSPGAKLARRPVEIGTTDWLPNLRWATDYFKQGVLFLRPLPPGVAWVWVAAGMLAVMYLLLQVLFPAPVQASLGMLEQRPVTSLFTGLLATILFAPVCVLLIATGVGVILLPLVLLAFVGAGLLGKAAVLRYVGHQLGRQMKPALLEHALLALVVGGGIVTMLYMVPVLGVFVWGSATLLGLGATSVAAVQHLSKENATRAEGLPPLPVNAVAGSGEAALQRVGFWKRLGATLLDFLIVGAVAGVATKGILFLPAWFLYLVGMWWWKGTTIGGMVFSLKIVREDGSPVTLIVALVRWLTSVFSLLALGLGFFWAGWSREKRAWHDQIAGTLVVQPARGMSLV